MSKTAQMTSRKKDLGLSDEKMGGQTHPSHAGHAQDQILSLQRSLGNHGVGQLLQLGVNRSSPDRSGVRIGQSGGPHEQEADHIAEQVAHLDTPHNSEANTAPKRRFQAAPEASISNSFGAGRPLPEPVRDVLESRVGYDLSHVRLHTGQSAAESARSINASAYTVGRNIVFGASQYAPETSAGQRLIAHEVTHVIQQGGDRVSAHGETSLIQRSPGPAANLELPWKKGDHSLFEVTSHGVRVLTGVSSADGARIRKVIPKITERVSKDNKLIKDPAFQVKTVFIASTTTRFALLVGEPVLMLAPVDADPETVAHEMGHAVFHALASIGASKAKDAAKSKNLTLQIADIFNRLADTKAATFKGLGGKDETHAIGLWMVDPSQVKAGGKVEHPWDDPDEFFASVKEAYQTDRSALVKSIEKAIRIDSKVKDPAKELIATLDDFLGSGKLTAASLSAKRLSEAETALGRRTGISNVEDTLDSNPTVEWLLDPTSRPTEEKAGPAVQSPLGTQKVPPAPNMVTGPGGVKERMEKRFKERLREKILKSVDELP